MRVLVLDSELSELTEMNISNDYRNLQKLVGGNFEIPYIGVLQKERILMYVNEKGKLIPGMNPSIVLSRTGGDEIEDIIYGNVVFVGEGRNGNDVSLSEKQISFVKEFIKSRLSFTFGPARVAFI